MGNNFMSENKIKAQICIYEKNDIIMTSYDDGVERSFVVTQEELAKLFGSSITIKQEAGLISVNGSGEQTQVMIQLPKRKAPRVVTVKSSGSDQERYEVKLPPLLCRAGFSTEQGITTLSSLSMWCYSGTLKASSILYAPPLPNVQTGSFCLGGVKQELLDEGYAATIESALFDSFFNTHYNTVTAAKIPFAEYMEQCDGNVSCRGLERVCRYEDLIEN